MTTAESARAAYDVMARFYDGFTAHHDYDAWTRTLERLARRHGLAGRTLLDVGCGTGKSFLPFLARGYEVTACDVSPRMAAIARAKAPQVPVRVCDVRALPRLGSFDLVCCLDDCLNHLLDERELGAALAAMAANLAPAGVLVFDLNTLATYRSFFAVRAALRRAGLDCAAVYGQGLDGVPHRGADELVDTKAVYVARPVRHA